LSEEYTARDAEEDIEATKRRHFEVTNYSALAAAALVGTTKLFVDDAIAQPPFFQIVFLAAVALGAMGLIAQLLLAVALTRQRIVVRKRRGEFAHQTVTWKTIRDIPWFAFHCAVPLFSAWVASAYILRRSNLTLEELLPWIPPNLPPLF